MHLFENVRILNVIRKRVDNRIVEMLWHDRSGLIICIAIFSAHGQLILHNAIQIMPVQLHLFLFPFPLIGVNFIRTFSMLSIVLLFVLKIDFFSLLKPFSLFYLPGELFSILIFSICLSHSLLILIVLWFLHFFLYRFLYVRLFQLVTHFIWRYVQVFVMILRFH